MFDEFNYTMLRAGDAILLKGPLGAGKTTFTLHLAKKMGVRVRVKSPTFTLMNIYPLPAPQKGLNKIVHIDCYRLKNPSELMHIGAKDFFDDPSALPVVEWPELGGTALRRLLKSRKKIIKIKIEHGKKKVQRIFSARIYKNGKII